MVPGEKGLSSFLERASRARELAGRFPEAGEALALYAEVATIQSESGALAAETLSRIVELVSARGPDILRRSAAELDAPRAVARYRSGEDRGSPASFFARVLLQLEGPCRGEHEHVPQLAVLRSEGDGTVLSLACALCFEEWAWPRAKCPACGAERDGAVVRLAAPELPHVEARACDDCRRYLSLVRIDREPFAIPEVDEMAAMALDLKARALGYEKIQPNLFGL